MPCEHLLEWLRMPKSTSSESIVLSDRCLSSRSEPHRQHRLLRTIQKMHVRYPFQLNYPSITDDHSFAQLKASWEITAMERFEWSMSTEYIPQIDSTPDTVTGDISSTDIEFPHDPVRIRISLSSLHLVSTATQPNVTTMAGSCNGFCNETLSESLTTLHTQGGIFVSNNGTLYVADGTPMNTLFSFEPNNRTGTQIMSFSNWPTYIFINSLTSTIYVTVFYLYQVTMWPSNKTIPPNNISSGCAMNLLNRPTGIVADSSGNAYVASKFCHLITKWAPNAASGILT